MKASPVPLLVLGGVAVVGAFALYAWRRGGVTAVASDVGAGAVNVVGGVASGAVGAVGAAVGLPTPSQTTEDPRVARWLIDRAGYFEASKWSGALALIRGAMLPEGSGIPPTANNPVGRAFAHLLTTSSILPTTGDFARLDRTTSSADTYAPNPYAPTTFEEGVTGDPYDLFGGGGYGGLVNPYGWGS